jgi:hypothetical protein
MVIVIVQEKLIDQIHQNLLQAISTATPMEDYSGSIDDVQTQIASIIPPNRLATQSYDLNPLSVDPKSSSEITNGEFYKI